VAPRQHHLLTHGVRQLGQRLRPGRCRLGGLQQGGQRGLQRVRQVAGLGARTLDDRGVARQHGVEVVHQPLHLGREAALEPRCLALAQARQGQAQPPQRRQPHAHLPPRGAAQQRQQHRQRGREHAVEARDRGLGLAQVGGHQQAPGGLVGGLVADGRAHRALHQPQAGAFGAGDLVHVHGGGGQLVRRGCERGVPERARAQHRGLFPRPAPVDLPVQA